LIIGGLAAVVTQFAVGEIFPMDFPARRPPISTRKRYVTLSRALAGVVMVLTGAIYLLFHE
jgi:hypothetical protein